MLREIGFEILWICGNSVAQLSRVNFINDNIVYNVSGLDIPEYHISR